MQSLSLAGCGRLRVDACWTNRSEAVEDMPIIHSLVVGISQHHSARESVGSLCYSASTKVGSERDV